MPLLRGFIGPTYEARSALISAMRTVNWYPEMNPVEETANGKVASFINTPGTDIILPAGDGPARGLYFATNNVGYYVRGQNVYTLTPSYQGGQLYQVTTELIGTLNTTIGPVNMVDNGTVICIVDGPDGYFSDLGSNSITQITSPDWQGSTSVAYLSGYFIFSKPNTGVIYATTEPFGTDFDALFFATAEASPDPVVAVLVSNNYLWVFGTRTIQAFFPNPTVDEDAFPFVPDAGSVLQTGTIAGQSVAYQDNQIFWLGANEKGAGVIYTNQGFAPRRISNHAVERFIQSYPNLEDAVGYAYQQEGHLFYVLNFTVANTTWVYDSVTDMWHQRSYLNQLSGAEERHRGQYYTFGYGAHMLGDYQDGTLYKFNLDRYYDRYNQETETGDYILRTRTSPHTQTDMLFNILFSRFVLDIEVGVGTDGGPPGNDPRVALQWSDDGGQTWSDEAWMPIGALGNYRARVQWFQLGMSNNRVWRVKMSDPVKSILLGAYYDAKATRA